MKTTPAFVNTSAVALRAMADKSAGRETLWVITLLCGLICLSAQTVHASEGGASFYFPGAWGSFGVALAPPSGFTFANQSLVYHADVNKAVLDGRVDLNLKVTAVYDLLTPLYTFEKPVLGAQYQIGAFIPVGYVKLDAGVGGSLGSRSGSANDFNLGDIGIIPAALYWKAGDFHFKLMESIIMPTGHYDVNNTINVGRHYWGFDTLFGMTWLNPKTGTEISALPGVMFNTENPDTNYHTGNEFHLDFTFNQFLSKNFAVGFQGYYYQQITSDSGSGAVLGDFKGESVGIGPAILWMPKFADGKLAAIVKWLHDVEADNRLKGDWGQVTVSYNF